jgi:hypothetical protein
MMPTVETQSELVFSRLQTAGGAEPKRTLKLPQYGKKLQE